MLLTRTLPEKVYISSTLDLAAYRQALIDCFMRLAPFFSIGKIAEWMVPDNRPPLPTCLGQVGESDLVILIIGLRYGSLVPDQSISFTHSEYIHATQTCNPPKEVIVLYADDGNQELAREKAGSEQEARFLSWRKSILDSHTSSVGGGFMSVQQMINQLQEYLLHRILGRMPQISPLAIELKCDRSQAVSQCRDAVYDMFAEGKQVFSVLSYGNPDDCPEIFTQRLALLEFGLPAKVSLKGETYGHSTEINRRMFSIRRLVYEALYPEEKSKMVTPQYGKSFASAAAFFELMKSRKVDKLFIEFMIAPKELAEERNRETLMNFIREMESHLPAEMYCYIAFSVSGLENYNSVATTYTAFQSVQTGTLDIGVFGKVLRTDIQDWIQQELKIDSGVKVNLLIDQYFGVGGFEYTMLETQVRLQKMVNKLFYNIA